MSQKQFILFILLIMLSTALARAQTSFDSEGGCLNVVDIISGHNTSDMGLMASISDDAYLVKTFDIQKKDDGSKFIHDLGINIGVCFQIKGW